jgi:putative oxidoreductase
MGAAPTGTWSYWRASAIEIVVGLLVMIGLFTRIAALIGSG